MSSEEMLAISARATTCRRHDEDAVGVEEALLVVEYARQHDVLAVSAHAAADAVAQRAGLLEDLFEHEVGLAPLFQLRDAHPEFLDVDLRLLVVHVEDVERLARLMTAISSSLR